MCSGPPHLILDHEWLSRAHDPKTPICGFLIALGIGTNKQVRGQLSFERHSQTCVAIGAPAARAACSACRLLLFLIHTHHISHGYGERCGKIQEGYLWGRQLGLWNCAFWRISVGYLKYVFIPLTFRESSSEFTRISDLPTLHAHPTPGAGASPGEGVRGNSAFYSSIWWAEG